jgi:HEAT repeat protein
MAFAVAGAITPLVELLRSGSDECKQAAATALGRDLASSHRGIAAAIVVAGAIPVLVELLRSGSDEVKKYAQAALGGLGVGGCSNCRR